MKKRKLLLLSISCGVLFTLAWPSYGFAPLLFIALVPLLYIEDLIYRNKGHYKPVHLFGYSYLAFFTWNLLSIWWIYYASAFGGTVAIIGNSFQMALVFTLFHFTRKKVSGTMGHFILILYWIAYEYFYLDWDLGWPWLTLGNGFASYYKWIQWYEFTGVHGGTLWILVVNILIFLLMKKFPLSPLPESRRKDFRSTILISSVILIIICPIIYSKYIYNNYKEEGDIINVEIVQPNIDPYNEKFSGNYQEQLKKILALSTSNLDSTIDYLVFPETALTENLWENELASSHSIPYLWEFLKKYPKLKMITGASTFKAYGPQEKLSETARKFSRQEGYYDAYNTAFQLDSSKNIQVYHKSKLVIGVEKMPFPSLLKPLEKLALDLGGTLGSLGSQKIRTVFVSCPPPEGDKVVCPPPEGDKGIAFGKPMATEGGGKLCPNIAPVICYESIFGEYVSEYVKNGAHAIFIITNDGWWADTQGYKQHLHYASLRAIENRRSIARSANTGISCFINQKGDISQATSWWKPAVIKSAIKLNSTLTFYSTYGDYIGRYCAFSSLLIAIYTLVVNFRGWVRKIIIDKFFRKAL